MLPPERSSTIGYDVETLDNIDRLDSPTTKEAVARHVELGRPFICKEILGGSPFERFDDRGAVIRTFGRGVIDFDASGKSAGITVADYFARSEVSKGSVNATLPPDLEVEVTALRGAARCSAARSALSWGWGRPDAFSASIATWTAATTS